MKSIIVRRTGKIEAEDGGAPPSKALGSVRVRVKYAGVGFADVMAVRGGYPLAPRRPFSPGYEFLGRVEDGNGSSLGPGQRVAGMLPRMGAYREFLDLDPRSIVPVPPGLGDEAAALLPLNYLTAYAMIERYAGLKEGQSFLIQGAAGGVGTAALELARLLGLRAYGIASGRKHELVAALGGIPLHREENRWVEELKRERGGGVDAAFDAFGIDSFRRSRRALGPGGTLVCYGISPSIDGGYADFVKGLAYLGAMRSFGLGRQVRICATPSLVGKDPAWYKTSLGSILEWAHKGRLKPTLAEIFPWNRVSEAHRLLVDGAIQGKLLLDFS